MLENVENQSSKDNRNAGPSGRLGCKFVLFVGRRFET